MKARVGRFVLVCVVSSCGLLLAFGILLLSQKAKVPGSEPSDAYDLPAKPGADSENQLGTHEDMLRAMSTQELLETVLNDRLYPSFRLYSSAQYGFDRVAANLSSLRELLNRADAGTETIARYRTMDPAAIEESWTLLQKGNHALSICNMEMLIAQDAILSRLTEAERRALVGEVLHKIEAKQSKADIHGEAGRQCSAFLLGRILEKEGIPGFRAMIEGNAMLRLFLDDGTISGPEIHDAIIIQARQFLSSATDSS
jgi:hypothetical protein